LGERLREDGQVAALAPVPRRRAHPARDLELDEHHDQGRTPRVREETLEQRRGDLVRQVRDDPGGRPRTGGVEIDRARVGLGDRAGRTPGRRNTSRRPRGSATSTRVRLDGHLQVHWPAEPRANIHAATFAAAAGSNALAPANPARTLFAAQVAGMNWKSPDAPDGLTAFG